MVQETFDLTDNGEIKDYLDTRFEKNKKYGSISLVQPIMVERIFELFGLDSTSENVKMHDTHACSNDILDNDSDVKPRVQ